MDNHLSHSSDTTVCPSAYPSFPCTGLSSISSGGDCRFAGNVDGHSKHKCSGPLHEKFRVGLEDSRHSGNRLRHSIFEMVSSSAKEVSALNSRWSLGESDASMSIISTFLHLSMIFYERKLYFFLPGII